ncbi:zinc finger protein PLAG1 [Gouania willdenowi]|uniref:zinc finger protein PLAG1 n=1 Tax=Gouania willdenowi TaxID=441366 RepID=UPI00105464BD|nr:zinc finger protein PLAG1 [Gouania willdenowi]XP_028290689.1 zinc finger protein PLAG1 [Gouania willdenowi]
MATGTQGHRDHVLDKARLAPPTGGRRRAEGKLKKNFPCQECEKAFNSVEKLKVHSYSHTGERPYGCSHPDCTKAFVSKYKLLRHMATHSPEKNHKCSYCEKMFHRKDHLKNHLHTHDPHKEAFTCTQCGKSYNTKLGFKRHLALHAANSGDLTCQVCLQPFPSTAVLLEHLKTHAGKSSGGAKEKKHLCEHCERRFYTRKDVRRHMVVHTGRKDFLCQYCAQRFGRKDHLTRHVKKSHARELLRVKMEPSDALEADVYDFKGELPRAHQLNLYTGPTPDTEPLPLSCSAHPFPFKHPLTSYALFPPGAEYSLKGELESYLMELQNSAPSSSSTVHEPTSSASKMELPQLDDGGEDAPLSKLSSAGGDAFMDFSQLFNFLPLNGPPYAQVGGGGGVGLPFMSSDDPTTVVQLSPPQPQAEPQAAEPPLLGIPAFISNLSTPTTLPRFHQAFQ